MTILLHTEAAESLPSYRGWLGGGGWRWLQSHKLPLGTANLLNSFGSIPAVIRVRVSATIATVGGSNND
jgi:hypothetical protein